MKRLLAVFIAAIMILTGCSPKKEENIYFAAIIDEIHDSDILVTTIDYDGGDVIILDVRTEAEFEEAHIAGAILLSDYDIEALAPEILPDKDKTILVYCRSGRRSEIAAKVLAEKTPNRSHVHSP